MFWDTLERVNRLRQEAMANPEFIRKRPMNPRGDMTNV